MLFSVMAAFLIIALYHRYMQARRPDRIIRDRANPFELSDAAFVKIFRVNKLIAFHLIDELRPELPSGRHPNGKTVSVEVKVLAALRFFATGAYQQNIGHDYTLDISQPSVSRAVRQVSDIMGRKLLHDWVKFPTSTGGQTNVKATFMASSGFPGCIGAIDCTHVAIVKPSENPEAFFNRKHYYSINVELICDANLVILACNPCYPGAVHDSFIWRASSVRRVLRSRRNSDDTSWLLGDSGYPLEPWLMTPFAQPSSREQNIFNTKHVLARNAIERCNGVLKARFRCLQRHRTLHYKPSTAARIINACVILHNMCMTYGMDIPGDHDDNAQPVVRPPPERPGALLNRGRAVRNSIAARLA